MRFVSRQRALLIVPAWQSKKQALTALICSRSKRCARGLADAQLRPRVLQRLISYTLPLRAIETYARAQL